MKRSYVVIAVVVVILAAAFWMWRRTGGERVAIDLVAQFPSAKQGTNVQPVAAAFTPGPQAIKGETRPAIYMHPTSRLTFERIAIPDDGRFQAWIGVKEEAWDKESDGVLFRFAVSDGRPAEQGGFYDELLNQHVDPAHNANDRRWIPVDIDLSAYAGQQLNLIFNTNSSVPGRGDNPQHDFAVWGAPAIVIRP